MFKDRSCIECESAAYEFASERLRSPLEPTQTCRLTGFDENPVLGFRRAAMRKSVPLVCVLPQ